MAVLTELSAECLIRKVYFTAYLLVSFFSGPIVSVLLERYNCRQITIAGTTLSVVAFIISTFSPNVEILIITYGLLAGEKHYLY